MNADRLKHVRIYFSGPMQYVKDNGIEWRKRLTDSLINSGFDKQNILDPTSTRTGKPPLEDEIRRIQIAKERNDYADVAKVSKMLIRHDLRMSDVSDCTILGLFREDSVFPKTIGTIHEVINAVEQHKPIYVLTDMEWQDFPVWLLGLLPGPYFWSKNIDQLIESLIRDITEPIEQDTKWVFVDKE